MNTVITISRQYGSGGTEIARRLAQQLDVPFYDREGLKEAATAMGMGEALLEAYGERHAGSLLLSLAMGAYSFGYHEASHDSPISQKPYLLAFDVVRRVAARGSCVIVGRCADYVLQPTGRCLSVFVHAPLAVRAETVARRDGLDTVQALDKIEKIDRLRRKYYNYYTDKSWGEMDSYHLSLDSSVLGLEHAAYMLESLVRARTDEPPYGEPANVIPFTARSVAALSR